MPEKNEIPGSPSAPVNFLDPDNDAPGPESGIAGSDLQHQGWTTKNRR